MCTCKDNNWCRTWEETQNGKYPPSEHAPGCDEYKPEEFARIELDRTYCIQEFVTKVTSSTEDEPPVMGCGGREQAWKDAYVARMVERGVHPDDARACVDACSDQNNYDEDPRDAADDELEYWENDEGA